MHRRLVMVGTMSIAIALCALALAGPSVAFAADNSSCLGCHEGPVGSLPAQAFDVGPVDRDTACASCHTPGMVGTHPYHQAGANCGAYCHPSWGNSLLTAVPNYTDPVSGASFASANSKNTPSAIVHIIHSNVRWPENVDTADSRCASCHSIAACSACHENAPTVRHAGHSSTTQSPWSGTTGHGVVAGDQTMLSAGPEANMCATAGCHDLVTTQSDTPLGRENFSHPAGNGMPENVVTLAPSASAWRERYSALYTLGRMSYSNIANATHTTTINGTHFQLVADRDPYRGIAEVWVDGVYTATIDLYAPTTTNQAIVYDSATLANGPHTVTIKVTGTKNPASRYSYVTVDCVKVYAELPDSIAPSCLQSGCHADKSSGHGGNFDHEATQTAGLYPAGRFDCTDCHSLSMWTEHDRASSKTAATGCATCHTVYADYTLNEFSNSATSGYGSCTWAGDGSVTGCHQVAQSEQPHNFIDSDHDASGIAATAECRSCHGDDLAVIHDDTNAARGQNASLASNGWSTDCLTCHGPNTFPTTKDCADSGCHTASGVVDMASHPAPPHTGSDNNAGVPRTGGELCSTCHILELTSEHGKSTSLTDPGAAVIGCADCHAASYFPAGWLDTPDATNTCVACHDPAGAADAGLPHESAEYAAKHDWSATEGGCDGALCHDVDMIDLIHTDPFNSTVSSPRGSSCQSCHTTPNAVPTVSSCSDCHTSHDTVTPHDPNATPALTAANADCLTCHTKFDQASGLIYHSGMCYTCHNHLPSNDLTHYLQDNYTAQCTDCHNSTVLGSYDYAAFDPNHYDPYLANHTATGMNAVLANKTCSSCHANSLKAEHVFTLSAGSVDCFDCHTMSAPIDAAGEVAANWTNDTCADCHGMNHGAAGLAVHDLSASATSLGCSAGGCHSADTDDIATLHLAAVDVGSNTSCNVCHSSADTDLSAISGCDSCHAGHDLTVHEVTVDTGNCLDCHGDDGAPADDVRGIHASCAQCHSNVTYPGIVTGKTSDCVDCHVDGLVAEPHNTPNGNYSPYDPNHYNGTAASHTADGGDTGYSNTDGNACVSCHVLEIKSEHFKTTSAFASVPGTYGDKCVACHEVSVDGLAGAWTGRCVACHSTASSHTGFDTVHDAPATYDTSCGGGGCHDTNNVDLIHKNSVTTNATVTTCLNTCHDTNTALPTSVSCDTAGCHAGGHGHELDLAGSNYDNGTIAGCTNSGAGCHGTSAGTDYQVYHPASGCTSGACHIAANKDNAQFNNPNTCQNCHGGGALLFDGAPDAVGLADASGHYSTVLHAATGLGTTARGFAGGTAGATCAQCHAPGSGTSGLYNQHQGLQALGATTCADCHNYSAGVTAEISGNWTNDTCADCHNGADMPGYAQHGTTAPVVTATEAAGAASCVTSGCHTTLNLHELHKGDALSTFSGCDLSGCHDYTKQGWKPTATSCGAGGSCHTTDAHDPNAHDSSVAGDTGGCTDCHESTDIRTVHSSGCGTCHNTGANLGGQPGNTADCVTCHDGDTAGGDVYYDGADNPVHLDHYTDVNTAAHTENGAINTGVTWGTTNYGRRLNYFFTGGTTADTVNNAYERPCGDCHTTDLYTEHTKASIDFDLQSYPNECVACHEIIVDGFGGTAWNLTCAGNGNACHDVSAANLHFGADSSKSWTTKHNASSWTLTSPGSASTSVIGGGGPTPAGGGALGAGFSDGFETNSFGNWTTVDQSGVGGWQAVFTEDFGSGSAVAWDGSTWNPGASATVGGTWVSAGTGGSDQFLTKTGISLAGATSARVRFQWRSIGAENSDTLELQYTTNGGGSWTAVGGNVCDGSNPGSFQQISTAIPTSANGIRFRANSNMALNAENNDAIFIDNVFVEGDMPASPGGWSVQTAQKSAGTYAARAVGTGPQWYNLTKTGIDNSNADSVDVSYAIRWDTLEAADDVVVQYTTNSGGAWTDIRNYTPGGANASKAWTTENFTGLPAGIDGIRFRFYADSDTADVLYIDAVTVTPQSNSGGQTATSCQNNPNGTECHNVSDVANIHALLPNDGCSVCHTGTAQHPSIKNCQASGCHPGVNIDEHDNHHDTNFVSASFDTAFSRSWCESCHIGAGGTGGVDGIDDEHEVLDAYHDTPCSMCHKKQADTGGAATVTRLNTVNTIDSRSASAGSAICDDCHKTFTKERPHVQRQTVKDNTTDTGMQFSSAATMNGHRVYASNTRSPQWMILGTMTWEGYTLGTPTQNRWLLGTSPWNTTNSMVTCADCHSDATIPTAPHAGTMNINIDPNYPTAYSTLQMTNTTTGFNSTTAICAKCHRLNNAGWSNNVHNEHVGRGNNGGYCTHCHAQVPHQSTHVRMLGLIGEGAAGLRSGGLTGIRPHSETPTGWSTSDCGAACDTSRHPYNGTDW